ncbi:phosphoribosylamine--glycine ligase [Fundicoccus culcitae]|uniref:Phosphoribosylamine--glycine ligase n=1 Tax=Fundicoccus culcitae TaxID=2969821 RepID=A0ABY5P914_9LACT|nr:phosphoribosylamine--glycine ligase [Fundicoccus culcitae]UUX35024.1 phosphoribosylamine--glycine ligase [Fundicoccus culcitae]
MNKKILVIGSGGREHAIARAFRDSQKVEKVFVAPGNPGMELDNAKHATPIECVDINIQAFEQLAAFVKENDIALTFVGPEQPLETGIVDYFNQEKLAIVGPTKEAAQLENSKWFAKKVMAEAGVQTAQYHYFTADQITQAKTYCQDLGLPFVIKADGLMAGKGVVIPESMDEAHLTLDQMMLHNQKAVLIEEFLVGTEFSHFSLVNEEHILALGSACDYKRVAANDTGLNTGGMGAFAPVPWVDDALNQQVIDTVVKPVAQQMVAQGTPFTGVLYSGLIMTASGPKVIEFNTRLGDPETQVLLPTLTTDFYEIVTAHLNQQPLQINIASQTLLGIVLAAQGYPGDYVKKIPVAIPSELLPQIVFAGVSGTSDQLYSSGGRILMAVASGHDLEEARTKAYATIEKIETVDTFYRPDIGCHRQLKGED